MQAVLDAVSTGLNEAEERFVRAIGPGGQNARREATAVELRVDIGHSSLPEPLKIRLAQLAGRAVTGDGILIVVSRAHRSQTANRNAARLRLARLLRRAATPPSVRRATRPDAAVREQRLKSKRIRGAVKALRAPLAAPRRSVRRA
jgi:ribosome-associated protein